VVVNIESTVQSIQRAIEEAQLMAGCRIHSAFVGVAGNHIRSLNSHGIVAIRDREVSSADLERARRRPGRGDSGRPARAAHPAAGLRDR
jgi:cell division protein FtsA